MSEQGCAHYGKELIEKNSSVCHDYQALRGTIYQCCSTTTSNPKDRAGGKHKGATGGEIGKCSWYGKGGEIIKGTLTACHERFNPAAMKVAHKTLPCGTKLLIKNKRNGKTVNVTVNDRGPFVHGRILDLTFAAFGIVENRNETVFPCDYEIL
ncbi:unnamed protein product [Orchesella dallaii]|uniref:RlpA-like protein double-psi beta-barrel domain-containing protein n=1 Tax=Orchesella dallaii TaxID=48710 RepID=A0ABP1RIF9_9HEXA